MLSSAFRTVFYRCFPVCVAFRIGFYSTFADSRLLHMPASTGICLSALCGGGGDGGGGGVAGLNRVYLAAGWLHFCIQVVLVLSTTDHATTQVM